MSYQQKNVVYNFVAFIFVDRNKAMLVHDELKASAKNEGYKIIANAVVEVDDKGKAHIHAEGLALK